MKVNNLWKPSILFAAIAAVGLPASGSAQVLEEVIVTAQKREQNLQEIPISVTALTGDQMNALGIKDFTEIIQSVI